MQAHPYYLSHKKSVLRSHQKLMRLGVEIITPRYTPEYAAQVERETNAEFEALIPDIPYIGGGANRFTDTMIQMTSLLALYRVLSRHGKPLPEIGEVIHAMAHAYVEDFPRLVRGLIGRFYMSRFWRERTRRRAAESQAREYAEDFVYEVVEGTGEEFEWGINYLECGVVKFMHRMGADELVPYMCIMDYILFPAMGIDLQRQGTIANGCTHCDFRFKHP